MLNEKIADLLNKQVNAEFYASNVYLQMCAWAEDQGLEGAADFFRNHSREEREHMDKIFNYMAECGVPVTIEAIPKAQRDYDDLMAVINAAFEHEKHVTAMIKNIAKNAFENEDYTTFNFIEWFIAEQHEEEVLFSKVLSHAEMMDFTGERGQKLLIMDGYLKKLAGEH